MENATKALIIAGSILIAIALVSMGVLLLSNTEGIFKTSKDLGDAIEIKTHNSMFEQYSGTQKGSTVKELYSLVQSYKKTSEKTLDYDGPITFNAYKNYNVTLSVDEDGYINKITVN